MLRRERPETRIVLSEPANAQLVGSGQAQERGPDHAPVGSHPAFEPHPIQGWTPDFIPYVLQEAIDAKLYDELVPIAASEGMKWTRALAQKEGIFTGVSGGATFAVARQVAERALPGSVILCMLPDTGERYMTTPAVRRHRGRDERRGNRPLALHTRGPVPGRVTGAKSDRHHGKALSPGDDETLDPDTGPASRRCRISASTMSAMVVPAI